MARKIIKLSCYFLLLSVTLLILPGGLNSREANIEDMKKNPQRYIEIEKWGFYVAARVAIVHHLVIKNSASIPYKDIKIKVNYGSTSPSNYGNTVSFEQAVLKITLPPDSTGEYLRSGYPIGAGSVNMIGKSIEVLSAVPVI